MKIPYTNAEIEIFSLQTQDVIRTSVAASHHFGIGENGRSDRLEDVR